MIGTMTTQRQYVTDPVVRDRYTKKPISSLFPQRLKKKEHTGPYWAVARGDGHCTSCGDEIGGGDKIVLVPKEKGMFCQYKCGSGMISAASQIIQKWKD